MLCLFVLFEVTLIVYVWRWSCNLLHGSRGWCRWAWGCVETERGATMGLFTSFNMNYFEMIW